ncbi:MAG: LuxR C-terminal-related transcriptional regulator [Chthoniobacterales bacterium]
MRAVDDRPSLGSSDVRAVVRLLGEIGGERDGHRRQVRRLMEGMATLIAADAWSWSRITNPDPDSLPAWIIEVHGGFDDARFAAFIRAQEHPGMRDLTAPFSERLGREARQLTSLRQWADPAGVFPTSGAGALWREADLMPGILSAKPLASGSVRAITLHRRADAPDFSERDARLAHILLSEVDWLQDESADTPRSGVNVLPPRLRTALNLLLQGYSRSRIAEHLGVSAHTANDYVKQIHRHFAVASHAELIRRFYGNQ